MERGSSSTSTSSSTSLNALCFGEEFPTTGAPCRVEVSGTGLTVRFNESMPTGLEATVSFHDLTVSAGGLNHDQLIVKWGKEPTARTVYLKDPALIHTFRAAAPPRLARNLEETAAKVRQVRSRQRRIWAVVLGLSGIFAFCFWFGSDLLVEFAVRQMPVE